MLFIQLLHQFLCVLALGIPINGASAGHHRQVVILPELDNLSLVYEHDRSDDRQIHAVQVRLWRKGVETSLEYQGQQHGLNDIVLVVGIGHLIAAHFLDRLIKGAFPHFRAQGAGVAFFALFK